MHAVIYAFMDIVLFSRHRKTCFRCSLAYEQDESSHDVLFFRFDIVVDEDLKPWLLEVNYSPDMARRSDVDKKVQRKKICLYLFLVLICL